jgi:hypothetical protein
MNATEKLRRELIDRSQTAHHPADRGDVKLVMGLATASPCSTAAADREGATA